MLVTGGASYIGAHTPCVALLEAGYPVLVFDSLVNGSTEALARASSSWSGEIAFVRGDVRDRAAGRAVCPLPGERRAASGRGQAVGESVARPRILPQK